MLQVIGAGFGRTGTHSLAAALETLGFGPCYHMIELSRNPAHLATWEAALEGEVVDWLAFFQGYRSTVEWPAVSFLPQIVAAHPQAKGVLTHRPPEVWYESARATIFDGLELSAFHPDPARREHGRIARRLILEKTFAGRHRDKGYAIQAYQRHIEQVRALVSPERLLEYSITAGWEPLCAFLGAGEPEGEFPWRHGRADFLSTEPEWAREARRKLAGEEGDPARGTA